MPSRLVRPITPSKNMFNRQNKQINFRWSSWFGRMCFKLAFVNFWTFWKLFKLTCNSTLYNFIVWFYKTEVAISHHHVSMTEFAVNVYLRARLCIGTGLVEILWKTKGSGITFLHHDFVSWENSNIYFLFDFVIDQSI